MPFRCRKCHVIGHLFRDCPLNKKEETQINPEPQQPDGFTKVTNRRRGGKKPNAPPKSSTVENSTPYTSNRFEALAKSTTQDEPNKENTTPNAPQQEKLISTQQSEQTQQVSEPWSNPDMDIDNPLQSKNKGKEAEGLAQESQSLEDDSEMIDLGEFDLQGLEQACDLGNFDTIPETQVDNLMEILNKAQKKYSLGVQTGSKWDGKFAFKDSKNRGRKTTLERTIKLGEVLVESGRYAKLTKYFNTNLNPSQ